MRLGIFAKTFARGTMEEVLDAVVVHGLSEVQFNLACAGLPTLPDHLDESACRRVRAAFESRGLRMAAISGTFNMIHPDREARRKGFAGFEVLVNSAKTLGTQVITLCTGTRDPDNMWRSHPENRTAAAWNELLESMEKALKLAAKADVLLAVEPEVSNVVDSAAKARLLLDHFKSPHLKIVMDAANLFHTGELPRMRKILAEAFELLGKDIVLAHAKDLTTDGDAGHQAAGTGVLDYDFYIQQLRQARFAGPLILHSLAEHEVAGCVRFLRDKLAAPLPTELI